MAVFLFPADLRIGGLQQGDQQGWRGPKNGAAFIHIAPRMTFKVVLASFGLEADRGLTQLGRLVRCFYIGDETMGGCCTLRNHTVRTAVGCGRR